MSNKKNQIFYLFSIGLLIVIVFLGYYVSEQIPSFVFPFLLFLCCLLLLPGAMYHIRPEQEPSAVSWKIFISIVIGCFSLFIGFIICLLKYIGIC